MKSKRMVLTIGIILLSLAGVFGFSSVLASPASGTVNSVTTTTTDITDEDTPPDYQSDTQPLGQTSTYSHIYTDAFRIKAMFGMFTPTVVPTTTRSLVRNESTVISVAVQLPTDAISGTAHIANFTITSQTDQSYERLTTGTIMAAGNDDLLITPLLQEGVTMPGTEITYTLTITNKGNDFNTFTASPINITFDYVIAPDEFALQAEESALVVVTVTVPTTALGKVDLANIIVANQFVSKTAVITTIGGYGLYLPVVVGPPSPPPEWERMPTVGWPQQDGGADRALALAVCTQNSTTITFAGTRNGVFSTTGNTWVREQGNNLPTSGAVVTGLAAEADCSEVYASIYESGVWRRNADGSWQRLGGSEVAFVRSIALDPNGRLFAGGGFDLHYWGGGAWRAANVPGDSARPIMHLSVSPSGSVYAVRWNTNTIWRLASNAAPLTGWQVAATLPANYTPIMLAIAGNDDGSLLEIGALDAHYQRRNGQWQLIRTQETRALSVIDSNQVYIGYADHTGVYLSENDGVFTRLNPGWAIPEKVYQLILAEGKLYAGTTNGVWTLSRSD